jgi:hypothetical protein
MESIISTLFGIFLRIGIPALITVAAGWLLYRLDARWQDETRKETTAQGKPVMVSNSGCWNAKGCTQENMKKCPAYIKRNEMPCWQAVRKSSGELREGCIGCEVLKQASVPIRA